MSALKDKVQNQLLNEVLNILPSLKQLHRTYRRRQKVLETWNHVQGQELDLTSKCSLSLLQSRRLYDSDFLYVGENRP